MRVELPIHSCRVKLDGLQPQIHEDTRILVSWNMLGIAVGELDAAGEPDAAEELDAEQDAAGRQVAVGEQDHVLVILTGGGGLLTGAAIATRAAISKNFMVIQGPAPNDVFNSGSTSSKFAVD